MSKTKDVACNRNGEIRLAARVSAQLVRERPFDFVEAIADDAIRIAALAMQCRRAGRTNTAAAKHREAALDEIARRYGANLVRGHDPRGMWLGLKLGSPRYQSAIFPLV